MILSDALRRNDAIKRGERTRLACGPSRLGEDFNPLNLFPPKGEDKMVVRVFGETPNTTRQRRVLPFSTAWFRIDPTQQGKKIDAGVLHLE